MGDDARGPDEALACPARAGERVADAAARLQGLGDGNFHCIYLVDPARPEEIAEAKRLNDRLVDRALALGGTCTGEHGIGYGKMASLEKEHGDLVPVMRAIKRALDPDNRMNPGKVVEI